MNKLVFLLSYHNFNYSTLSNKREKSNIFLSFCKFFLKNVPGRNGGCSSHVLPSLTHKNCILGPKSNIGCSEAVERLLNEPPFVPGSYGDSPVTYRFFCFWPQTSILAQPLSFKDFMRGGARRPINLFMFA